jgi:hypothetical protein
MSARHRPARNASNVVNLTRYKKTLFLLTPIFQRS